MSLLKYSWFDKRAFVQLNPKQQNTQTGNGTDLVGGRTDWSFMLNRLAPRFWCTVIAHHTWSYVTGLTLQQPGQHEATAILLQNLVQVRIYRLSLWRFVLSGCTTRAVVTFWNCLHKRKILTQLFKFCNLFQLKRGFLMCVARVMKNRERNLRQRYLGHFCTFVAKL